MSGIEAVLARNLKSGDIARLRDGSWMTVAESEPDAHRRLLGDWRITWANGITGGFDSDYPMVRQTD